MDRSEAAREADSSIRAQQIRLLREQQNFSQRDLALASGLSRNTLSLLERGQTSPTLTTLQKIAAALHISVDSFFHDVTRPESTNDLVGSDLQDPILVLPADTGTSGIEGLISALIMRLEPNDRCGSFLPHSGKTYVHCLSGACLVTVDFLQLFIPRVITFSDSYFLVLSALNH